MATSRSSSRSRALRETWTPEQAAEYAALREFRLLQLLSKDRRAAATAQRLGVFSAPSSPQRANVPAAEQDAGDKRGRRYSTKQQERRILRHDRYVELQQSVRLWRTAKAFFYWRAYVRSVRSAPGADTVDCFAAASSSAPPPPLSTFVFNAGEPVRFDFGVTNPPPAFAPPPPPQPSSLGEPIAPIPSGVRALVAEWPPLQPRYASKREGRPKAAGDAPATPDANQTGRCRGRCHGARCSFHASSRFRAGGARVAHRGQRRAEQEKLGRGSRSSFRSPTRARWRSR